MPISDIVDLIKRKAKQSAGGAPNYFESIPVIHPAEPEYDGMRVIRTRSDIYAMKLARLWRAGCITFMCVSTFTASGWILLAQRQTVVREFVTVNDKTGEPDEVISHNSLKPLPIMIDWELRELIRCAFERSSDDNMNIVNRRKLSVFLGGNEQPVLEWKKWHDANDSKDTYRIISDNDPQKIIVQTTDSDMTWIVRWKEQEWIDKREQPPRMMYARVIFEYRQPARGKVFNSASGLFVKNWQFQPE